MGLKSEQELEIVTGWASNPMLAIGIVISGALAMLKQLPLTSAL